MLNVLTEGATSTTPSFDFSAIDFSVVGNTFVEVLGIGAATVIAIVAIKKGWNFLMGMLKRA